MSRKNRRYGANVWKDGRDPDLNKHLALAFNTKIETHEFKFPISKVITHEDRYKGKPLIGAILTEEQKEFCKKWYENELNALLGLDKTDKEKDSD